jgi:hypothetical protein
MLTSVCEKEKKSMHTCLQAYCFFKLSPMDMAKFFPPGVGPVNVLVFLCPISWAGLLRSV